MNNFSLKFQYVNVRTKETVKRWFKNEKSANENTGNAFWIYAGIVIGLLALGIIVQFTTGAFTSIGNWFQNAVTGGTTSPNGWGTGGTGGN